MLGKLIADIKEKTKKALPPGQQLTLFEEIAKTGRWDVWAGIQKTLTPKKKK